MYNGDVGGVSGGNNNIHWNRNLAEKLDAADGKKDGKINASVWNSFLDKVGSSGNRINNFINIDNASKSFNYYDTKKDSGKVQWDNWESMYNDFVSSNAKTQDLDGTSSRLKPAAPAPIKDQPPVYYSGSVASQQLESGDPAPLKDQPPVYYNGSGASQQLESGDPAPLKDQPPVYYNDQSNVRDNQEKDLSQTSTGPKVEVPDDNSKVPESVAANQNEPLENDQDKTGSKKLTSEDIQNSIKNLKPGESYTYTNTISSKWGNGPSYEQKTITWRREADSTLTKTNLEPSFDSNGRRFSMSVSEHYSADGTTLLSRDTTASTLRFARELRSTENYENGKPATLTTNLSNMDKQLNKLILHSSYDSVTRLLKSLSEQPLNQSSKFSTQEFKVSNGNSAVIFKDNKFFNADGKEISFDKAHKILSKLYDNNQLASLVQNYK